MNAMGLPSPRRQPMTTCNHGSIVVDELTGDHLSQWQLRDSITKDTVLIRPDMVPVLTELLEQFQQCVFDRYDVDSLSVRPHPGRTGVQRIGHTGETILTAFNGKIEITEQIDDADQVRWELKENVNSSGIPIWPCEIDNVIESLLSFRIACARKYDTVAHGQQITDASEFVDVQI